MPDPLPFLCPQCGRRPWQLDTKELLQWQAQDEVPCPFCLRHWAQPHSTGPISPRCAGCGKRTTALKGDVCADCRHNGTEVQPLFDLEAYRAR
jgi:hypothetical protein